MGALDLTTQWPVPNVAAAAVCDGDVVASVGDASHVFRLASLSKPILAWAALVAAEEGTIALDQPVGQPGCTIRHLLAHAGGYPFDGATPIAAPERTRIYSNTGIEMVAAAIEASSDMSMAEYLRLAVFEPLDMPSSELRGSPAHGIWSTVTDIARFLGEVTRPTLISQPSADEALRVHYPLLSGIVPGVGRYGQCPWGLGFEIRGSKSPHWTGTRNSTATAGHFGGAGTMMWVDPVAEVSMVALTDRTYDEWADQALQRWPEISDAVLAEFGRTSSSFGPADAGAEP